MIDALDARILHAVQLSPRVAFRRISEVVGASEQTVARRYHRLRRDGVMRVVAVENRWTQQDAQWVCRIKAKAERISQLADALSRRPDVAHAHIMSGWTELACIVRAPLTHDRSNAVLQQIPRAASVIDVNVDLVLHTFGQTATALWTGHGHGLDARQAQQILSGTIAQPPLAKPIRLAAEDRLVLDALAEDGRAPHALLADRIGWPVAKVSRRLARLEASGAVFYDTDVLPERLGYHLNAMLWLAVTPRHLDDVGERIAAHPEIAFCSAMTGPDNLMAVVISRDVEDLYRYLSTRLAMVPHVQNCDVRIRTQTLKQHGSIVAHGRFVNSHSSTHH